MKQDTAVAVIGAGPYGLSIAAHLRSLGIEHRVFGRPMETWISGMPEGMHLKSDGIASNLYEPSRSFTLERFCAERSLPYSPSAQNVPVALSTFVDYGLAFQQRFVPDLENRVVRSVTRHDRGFGLTLEDGEQLTAGRVVAATGIGQFRRVPPVLDAVPDEYVTHSSRHSALAPFDGLSVAVIGAGSSALDLAALLHERGTAVELFCRASSVYFHPPSVYPRSLPSRLRHPQSALGPGWHSLLSVDAAPLYRYLRESFRLEFLRTHLGPAGSWFLRDQLVDKVPIHLSCTVQGASIDNGRVQLAVMDAEGTERHHEFDHVVAATGYRVDLGRLPFLGPELLDKIIRVDGYPLVSAHFESSIPGLYFAGLTTGASFGPLVRFAYGAKLTARRISRHLRDARPG